jgi:hypothetical protein
MFCLRKTVLLTALTLLYCLAGAQSASKPQKPNLSIGGHYLYGSFLTNQPKAAYLRDSYSYFGELNLEVQTDGSKPWQVANGLPQWGVGLHYGNLGSKQHMGDLVALFSYMNTPLFKYRAVQSKFRIGAGVGWIEKPWDAETNHKGVLLGSHLNAYLHLLWQNEFRITPRLFASVGLGFSHLSNGGSTLPNLGVNTPMVQGGLRYSFHEPRIEPTNLKDSFSRRPFYRVFVGGASKQYPWVDGKRYLITIINAEAVKRTSYKHQWAAGVMVTHNPSLEFDPSGLLSIKKEGYRVQAGVYGTYERLFGKMAIPVQVGAYVYNRDRFPVVYQQIGLRYQATPRLAASALLKTHLGKADFINVGIGYTFKKTR